MRRALPEVRSSERPSLAGEQAAAPNGADTRRAIEVIVQTAGVDLFRDYGIAVAPVPRIATAPCQPTPDSFGSAVPFHGPSVHGTLAFWVAQATLRRTVPAEASHLNERDWVRELCNQLMGRIKRRCMRYQILLQSGVPALVDPKNFEPMTKSQPAALFLFRALTGPVIVWLGGDLERAPFNFAGGVDVVPEGDLVIF